MVRYLKRLKSSRLGRVQAFPMYGGLGMSAPSLHRESTDSLIYHNHSLPGAAPPTNVMAVQDGPTSILVSWSPPDPLGNTTGYRIDYTDGSSSGSVTVSGGSTLSYTLTDLLNGATYNISIVATSNQFPSESVVVMDVPLGMLYCLIWSPLQLHVHCE